MHQSPIEQAKTASSMVWHQSATRWYCLDLSHQDDYIHLRGSEVSAARFLPVQGQSLRSQAIKHDQSWIFTTFSKPGGCRQFLQQSIVWPVNPQHHPGTTTFRCCLFYAHRRAEAYRTQQGMVYSAVGCTPAFMVAVAGSIPAFPTCPYFRAGSALERECYPRGNRCLWLVLIVLFMSVPYCSPAEVSDGWTHFPNPGQTRR